MDLRIQQVQESLSSATSGMTREQLSWHPQGKWSTAEILEHLSLTYSGTKIVFDRSLQAGRPSATPPSLKQRLSTLFVVKLGYLPGGRQAPAGTRPKGAAPETVLANLQNHLAAMDEAITHCEQRFGSRTKLVDHPILGALTAAEWRKFHWVHTRHHVRQIEQLKRSTGLSSAR